MKPLVIDLYAGLGGWSKGFLAEGWHAVGFDIERHEYGDKRYPAQLVLQDVLTLHGSQFRNAACIVASPPCQRYSYMAMPWKPAKALIAWYKESPERLKDLNALFDACFRIQIEASKAAGRYIPMVVENVKGAQPWVGRAKAHYGSYYLWGDVEDIGGRIVRSGPVEFGMPSVRAIRQLKQPGRNFHFPEKYGIPSPSFHGAEHEPSVVAALAIKNDGGSWFNIGSPGQTEVNRNPVHEGVKQHGSGAAWFDKALDERRKGATKGGGDWFSSGDGMSIQRHANSHSNARKAASAAIAEIPFDLSSHIARCFHP